LTVDVRRADFRPRGWQLTKSIGTLRIERRHSKIEGSARRDLYRIQPLEHGPGLAEQAAVLALLAFVLAFSTPVAADAQALPRTVAGMAYIDAASALLSPLAPAVAFVAPGRAGGAEVTLHNENTREDLTVYLRFDGVVDEATGKQLASFFRCKRTGRKRAMDAGVLGLFAQLASHYPGKTIEVVSGVRAPGYGVRDSKHYTGHAIDFRVRGVPTRQVRDLAWSLDAAMGVGHYTGENFLHIDHRPGEQKIAWEQRRQGSPNRYNPRWSKQHVAHKGLRSEQPRW
jgi:uncharacterized protein YcbK (DUF882 family)